MSHAPGPAAALHQGGKSVDQQQQHVYAAKWWHSPLQSPNSGKRASFTSPFNEKQTRKGILVPHKAVAYALKGKTEMGLSKNNGKQIS